MNKWAYYNEIDPYAAQWIRNLIKAGCVAPGEVDERSIVDVQPEDLKGFCQVHMFAGIAGWSYALRLAGWPDDRPVWTGSVPCQPYSVASVAHGGAKGVSDHRDLWPVFFALASELRPARLYGEQVAAALKWGWWDRAALDLEGEGYAAAASVLRGDACGADHERKRLYWMADSSREGRQGHQPVECLSITTPTPLSEHGDPLARARRILAGDHSDLLPSDGVSIAVERCATKGYGNAIVPQVAAVFVMANVEVSGRERPYANGPLDRRVRRHGTPREE